MAWSPNLSQNYQCDRNVLITSGCSFTSSTLTLDCASSWPGFVRDRCKFDHVVDWSFPGVGNLYIADSIINYVKSLTDNQKKEAFVIVMWTGLDREEDTVVSVKQPCLNNTSYQLRRFNILTKQQQALDSYNHIINTKEYLEKENIPFAFTFYINLLYSPYLPYRDTTHTFESVLDSHQVNNLRQLPWVPTDPKQYLYDFSFYNNYLEKSSDMYHPPGECVLDWTDSVLLPSLAKQKLIIKCSI